MANLKGFLCLSPAPCFAVPVFDEGLQHVRGKHISSFTPLHADLKAGIISSAAQLVRYTGDTPVYGFAFLKDDIFCGDKDAVAAQIRARIDICALNPVMRLEIAAFLGENIEHAQSDMKEYLKSLGLDLA